MVRAFRDPQKYNSEEYRTSANSSKSAIRANRKHFNTPNEYVKHPHPLP